MPCSPEGRNDRRINQFDKICTLNTIANSLAEKYGNSTLISEMDTCCGVIPAGSFDQAVDLSAAHKSLTRLMHIAEKRYAYAVTDILKSGKADPETLQKELEEAGKADAAPAGISLEDAVSYVFMRYLDGMPCDDTKKIEKYTSSAITWEKTVDTHEDHWNAFGGDINHYYDLLKSYINGLLSAAGYSLKIENNEKFTICR